MKLDPILTKASRLARKKKYESAIRTLEPEVMRFRGSFRYYYILGASCLYAGNYSGALTYFRSAYDAKKKPDPLAILGLAVLHLRRNETDRAIDYYLEALEIDPKNRLAKKAMKIIRKNAGTDTFLSWLESGRLHKLFPSIPFPGFSAKSIFAFISILLVLCVITFGLLVQFNVIAFRKYSKQGIEEFFLTDIETNGFVEDGGDYNYNFENLADALKYYEDALWCFNDDKNEMAKTKLNRILYSNAPDTLKNKAQILKDFLLEEKPGFHNLTERISYSEINADPLLYEGVNVLWEGTAVNVIASDNSTEFFLQIDYNPFSGEAATWQGWLVQVIFNEYKEVYTDRPVGVLGKIKIEDHHFRIEGINLRQEGQLRNN
ncbi:MAG: tetratricopeptide repeat protein [Treponema sp.]|nr:tetratricopeptide repeat protein [Treponema sp.]